LGERFQNQPLCFSKRLRQYSIKADPVGAGSHEHRVSIPVSVIVSLSPSPFISVRDLRAHPVKYYKDDGFIERKIEIDEHDLERIIEEYLSRHADFDFDEIEIVNNRPMNICLYAKCRSYIYPHAPEQEQVADAEVQVPGKYDGNPAGS
jgi:hypothetical protein